MSSVRFRMFNGLRETVRDSETTIRTMRGGQPQSKDPGESSVSGPGPDRKWQLASWTLADGQRYAVLREHARGGLGRILEASDRRLNRPVALKELIRAGDEDDEARFMREAFITARLEHPAIVPVHDVGRWPSGEPFIAMKMIAGRSLRDLLAQKNSLVERLSLLPNVIAVADAMAYAHSQRVIHRDLNPSNVLIGEFGETFVVDWGLVTEVNKKKATSLIGAADFKSAPSPQTLSGRGDERNGDPRLTVTGVVLGTAQYMPPEQAEGEPVDERADVYAIGSILYHLLAGLPPYEGKATEEVLEEVLKRPPIALDRRQRGLAPELVTIVQKAMARSPAERYPTAKELAEDLKRFQTGQLVSAHNYSLPSLIARRIKRYRLPATLFAACLVAVVAMAAVSVRRIIQQKLQDAARNEHILIQARAALESDPTASIAWLKQYPADAINWTTVRDVAVEAVSAGVAKHVIKTGVLYAPALSPDGKLLATAGYGKNVQLWDVASQTLLREAPYSGQVARTEFSPDGKLVLFYSSANSSIHLWDIESDFVRTLRGHEGRIPRAVFSSNGKWVLSASLDRSIRIWSTTSDESRILGRLRGVPTSISFSPDDDRFATVTDDGVVELWDLSGRRSVVFRGAPNPAGVLEFSRNGRFLASGANDGSVWLSDLRDRHIGRFREDPKAVRALAFSADSTQLAVASDDGPVRVWNLVTDRSQAFKRQSQDVWSLAFSPTQDVLVSGGQDGAVVFWDISTGEPLDILRGHRATVLNISFSPDGRTLVTASTDETTRVWRDLTEPSRIFTGHDGYVYDVVWFNGNAQFATASRDQTVRIWDVNKGSSRVLRGHEDQIFRLALSPDESKLASASFDNTIRIWDVATGRSRVLLGHKDIVWDVRFSADGSKLGSASSDGTVRIWDVRSWKSTALRGHESDVWSVAFSPDGRLLASGSSDKTVRLWNTTTGSSRVLAGHQDTVYRVVFSPDGASVASASHDGTVRIWNVATGKSEVLRGHTGRVRSVSFSPDGKRLVSTSVDGTLRIWNVQTKQSQLLIGHKALVYEAVFSPDGHWIASVSMDRTMRVWDAESGLPVAVHRHGDEVRRVAFSPNGRELVSVSRDQTARIWGVEASSTIPREITALHSWFSDLTAMEIDSQTDRGGR